MMVVNGTSWVGFGWRPRKLTAECRKFPVIKDIGDTSAEPSAEPGHSQAEPEPSSESEVSEILPFFKSQYVSQ